MGIFREYFEIFWEFVGGMFWEFVRNSLGICWEFYRNYFEFFRKFWGSYLNMEGIDFFVRILVFVKILGKGRRKEEISILRSV